MRPIPKLFAEPHTKLVPFITAGFPDRSLTLELALALEAAGAHMLEIGMPFSDPLADGPVIQQASQQALEQGATLPWILEMVADLNQTLTIPVVLMGYFNPILQLGEEKFIKLAAEAGVAGLIIPDLPPGLRDSFLNLAQERGISVIPLVAPNTSKSRIAMIGQQYSDLLYAVSLMGVTGSEQQDESRLASYLKRIRSATATPYMVGFGIATPDDAARIGTQADGIVIGSALIKRLQGATDPVAEAGRYISSIAQALL